MEFNILYYLALHPGWTFTREQLYQYAMPNDFASDLESVTSRIYKIRKKLRQHRTENCVQKMSLRGKIKT